MRTILFIVLFVVAAFIGGIAFILFNLDAFVKEVVEKVGTEVTQVSVTLDDTNIDPANGKASMSGLKIANPNGFVSDHAMALGLISVKMDPTTVTGDVLVINEIIIDSPSVIYEIGDNGANIDKIHENVMAFAEKLSAEAGGESSGGSSTSTEEAPSEEASSGPKMIIENVYIKNIMTAVNLGILGNQTVEVPSVDVHLTDIGKKEGGVLAVEAAVYVIDNLFKDIVANASSSSSQLLEDALGKVGGEEIEKALEEVNEATGGAINVEEVGKEAEKALQNLFGTGN